MNTDLKFWIAIVFFHVYDLKCDIETAFWTYLKDLTLFAFHFIQNYADLM